MWRPSAGHLKEHQTKPASKGTRAATSGTREGQCKLLTKLVIVHSICSSAAALLHRPDAKNQSYYVAPLCLSLFLDDFMAKIAMLLLDHSTTHDLGQGLMSDGARVNQLTNIWMYMGQSIIAAWESLKGFMPGKLMSVIHMKIKALT